MRHESTNPKAQKVSSMINPKTPAPRYIIITRLKQRDNLESSKKALTCYTQGILKKIHSWSLIGNHKGKKTMGRHNLYWKGKKNPSTKNPISSKSVLQKKEGQGLPWWLRTHLPMQKTWAQSLVQKDHTRHGTTKPVHHDYWAGGLEPRSCNHCAHTPQLLKPTCPGARGRGESRMRTPCSTTTGPVV